MQIKVTPAVKRKENEETVELVGQSDDNDTRSSKLFSLLCPLLLVTIFCLCALSVLLVCLIGQFVMLSHMVHPIDQEYHYVGFWHGPEQIHLSMGVNSTQMYVTFSTPEKANFCDVQYGIKSTLPSSNRSFKRVARAESKSWKSLSNDTRYYTITKQSQSISRRINSTRAKISNVRVLHSHRALMKNLSPGHTYNYKIVCKIHNKREESVVYTFKAMSNVKYANLAIYGDLGLVNGVSIPNIASDLQRDMYDAIIHNGDFAYNLDTDHGEYGDRFMNKIEPIASRVPYMTSVGNHEINHNFSHYDNRFTMVNRDGEINNFFYSFDIGPVHFVAISTEFYYFLDYIGTVPVYNQWNWLNEDLARAASQRDKRPWIIVFGHRPFYCSADDNDDCTKDADILRKGLPLVQSFGLEKLFYRYGVDVLLWSHEHEYERFLPLYDRQVYNGTTDPNDPYRNPRAPVQLITGSAGCQENLDHFKKPPKPGSVVRIADYGYTRLRATMNKLEFEQVSAGKISSIVDKFVISKTKQNFPLSAQELEQQ